MKTPVHKVIITGTGRAGTTFLVRLLTELGLDTGYKGDNWQKDYFAHCEAGLEHDLSKPAGPYIVKNPGICKTLEDTLASGEMVIDHALIPMRDLDAATASRVRVGGTNGSLPGGLLHTSDPAQQKAVLAEMFHQLVMTLGTHNIPHTFLVFPRFVKDAEYTYGQLKKAFPEIDRTVFIEAFRRIADPQLVHTFKADLPRPAAEVASFQDAQRRKRLWRRVRRYSAYTAMAASLALNFGWRTSLHASHPAVAHATTTETISASSFASAAAPSITFAADAASLSSEWLPSLACLPQTERLTPSTEKLADGAVTEKKSLIPPVFLLSAVLAENTSEATIEPLPTARTSEIR